MSQEKGFQNYKNHWEEKANFMDKQKPPWNVNKILKLTVSNNFNRNIEGLKFSSHSLIKGNEFLTLRLKVPYNYDEIDDFKLKAIGLLGIEENWLTDLTLEDCKCTHQVKKNEH